VISEYTSETIGGGGGVENKCILKDSIKCAAHRKQSETRNICKFCIFLLRKGSLSEEIPFSDQLLDYLFAVSEVFGSVA